MQRDEGEFKTPGKVEKDIMALDISNSLDFKGSDTNEQNAIASQNEKTPITTEKMDVNQTYSQVKKK